MDDFEKVAKESGRASVDVLVSEWMGYFLFTEDVMSEMLKARDALLKADGVMIPHEATLYVQPVQDEKWWSDNALFMQEPEANKYGLDFSPLWDNLKDGQGTKHPWPIRVGHFGHLPGQRLLARRRVACHVSLKYAQWDKDWSCGDDEQRGIKFKDVKKTWHGWLFSFDLKMLPPGDDPEAAKKYLFSTAPGAKEKNAYTHWGQILWPRPFDTVVPKEADFEKGEEVPKADLEASFMVAREPKQFAHNFYMTYQYGSEDEVELEVQGLTADDLGIEDASIQQRLHENMISMNQRRSAAKKAKKTDGEKAEL